MSPLELKMPWIAMSPLMIEGADAPRPRLAAAGTATDGCVAGTLSLFLLENMAAGLDEIVGILGDVIIPDFVMDMRSGAAPGGADPPQASALADMGSDP